ncbi:hypothetical protein MTO96_044158, partial [Rhipicephalus appendiculatus]
TDELEAIAKELKQPEALKRAHVGDDDFGEQYGSVWKYQELSIDTLKKRCGQKDVLVQCHRTVLKRVMLCCLHGNIRKEHCIDALEIEISSDTLVLPNGVADLAEVTDLQLVGGTPLPTHNDRNDLEILKRADTNRGIVISAEIENIQS